MRHITLTCPSCAATEKAVGHYHGDGATGGGWYCFACRSQGSFQLSFSIDGADRVAPEAVNEDE